jgi:hypothetical protein
MLAREQLRVGNAGEALRIAGQVASTAQSGDFEAVSLIGQILYKSGRHEELLDFLSGEPEFRNSARGRVLRARLLFREGELEREEQLLRETSQQALDPVARRIVAFELVRCLDTQQKYTEAWFIASQEHQRRTNRYPVHVLDATLRNTAAAASEELKRVRRADQPAALSAVLLGMPRSGTTLLEQMLDRHSGIVGVGEHEFAGEMLDEIADLGGGWPVGALRVPTAALNQMQTRYLQGTRVRFQVPADSWVLDKTVFPMMQPLFVACILPGGSVIRLSRCARDNAVSLFLNNMHPSWSWTSSLQSIHAVLMSERRWVNAILQKLDIPTHCLKYEDLVKHPELEIEKVLRFLGVSFEQGCLHPDLNQRLVFTPSEEQVKKPVKQDRMGRWENYAQFFDDSWKTLDELD